MHQQAGSHEYVQSVNPKNIAVNKFLLYSTLEKVTSLSVLPN